MNDFGAALEDVRTGRDISLRTLATRAGVSPSTISRLETGGRFPSREMVTRLCVALGASDPECDLLFFAAGYVRPEHRVIA